MKAAATIILATSVGIVVMLAILVEMHGKCGLCWQGLLQVSSNRY
jgi:hypothetical protein